MINRAGAKNKIATIWSTHIIVLSFGRLYLRGDFAECPASQPFNLLGDTAVAGAGLPFVPYQLKVKGKKLYQNKNKDLLSLPFLSFVLANAKLRSLNS